MSALRFLAGLAVLMLVLRGSISVDAQTGAFGGFVESAASTAVRPALTAAAAQAFLPARGAFSFPPPYSTSAVRLTNASDCGGLDCVLPVGYSYWSNINNHTASETMLVVLGLDRNKGGGGPTLFSVNKNTGEAKNLGAMFPSNNPLASATGEGWYFSRTRPHALYINQGPRLTRYDVVLHTSETVFDITSRFGPNLYVFQAHSSNDDRVHSATLRSTTTDEMHGCVVYREDTARWWAFPKQGDFDECQVDKSGRWLVIKENVDGRYGEDNRVIDLDLGVEQVLPDEFGAGGHSDLGFGYMVAEDNFNALPGAVRLWRFDIGNAPGQGSLVYHLASWLSGLGHIAHGNARPGVPAGQQMVCSSNASRLPLPRANEIVCYRLDGSLNTLVVAPNLTDLNAPGGGSDDYSKSPKGNLDVTGEYFIWTANAGTARLDAYIVHVPTGRLAGGPGTPSAPANLLAMVNGSQLALSWTNTFGGGAATGLVLSVGGSISNSFVLPFGETLVYDNVPAGTYTLTLSAYNAYGASVPSNPVIVTFPGACSGVPGPPASLQATKYGSYVMLAWQPPESGAAATSYTLLVSGAWTGAIPTTARVLSGAVAPGSYAVSVAAANACGSGPATPPQVVTIP